MASSPSTQGPAHRALDFARQHSSVGTQIPPQSRVILQRISRHRKLYHPLSGIRLFMSPQPQAHQEVFLKAWFFNDPTHTNCYQCKFIRLYPKPTKSKMMGMGPKNHPRNIYLISMGANHQATGETRQNSCPYEAGIDILTKPSIQCLSILKLKNHCATVLIWRNGQHLYGLCVCVYMHVFIHLVTLQAIHCSASKSKETPRQSVCLPSIYYPHTHTYAHTHTHMHTHTHLLRQMPLKDKTSWARRKREFFILKIAWYFEKCVHFFLFH